LPQWRCTPTKDAAGTGVGADSTRLDFDHASDRLDRARDLWRGLETAKARRVHHRFEAGPRHRKELQLGDPSAEISA
jgi:hypothetical protein